MYGGLKKSASRLALVAAAGMLSTGAYAADLGGDCCADLEERVAELEATTARKGNRKVSLTISGQVNRAIMYWNDGGRSNTFIGIDNSNSSSRFGFSGNAKISPTFSAGYSILLDVRDKGRGALVSQTSEDGSSQERSGNANGDNLIRLRDANVWLESSTLGRLTLGRLTTAGSTGVIDLGGISVIAPTSEGSLGNSLRFRDSAGVLTGISINLLSHSNAHPTFREEAIRYNSPTFGGFALAASWAEATKVERPLENGVYNASTGGGSIGRALGAHIVYAGEFSGVRIAGSVGVEDSRGNDDNASGVTTNGNYKSLNGALSLMHVPTGLFVQGYIDSGKNKSADNTVAGSPLTGLEAKANMWQAQAGISQNWFGVGKTNLYGEYIRFAGMQGLHATTTVAGQTDDTLRIWGLGFVQNFDAAALELYLGWRSYKGIDIAQTLGATPLQTIDVVTAGARIKF